MAENCNELVENHLAQPDFMLKSIQLAVGRPLDPSARANSAPVLASQLS